jgi:hypothetical protein
MPTETLRPACRWTWFLALVVGLLAGGACRAAEVRSLRDEIRTAVAVYVQKLLEEEKQETVAVGEFTGPAGFESNAGPGIQQLLIEELKALKVKVAKRAALSVKGDYQQVPDPDDKTRIAVKIMARVLDAAGGEKGRCDALLRSSADIARLLGLTAKLPPPDEPGAGKARNQELKKQAENPQVHIDGSKVSASPQSKFAVEILVKAAPDAPAEPRPARVEDGQAFVAIKRNEIYEVRLYNRTGDEAAATVTIDGLDVFAFSEVRDPKTGRPLYSHLIVDPGESVIPGWHLRDRPPHNVASFLVTEYGKGALARGVAAAQGQRGVITVTFAPCTKDKPRGGEETGLGPPLSVQVAPVERSVGPILETVSIRYTRDTPPAAPPPAAPPPPDLPPGDAPAPPKP